MKINILIAILSMTLLTTTIGASQADDQYRTDFSQKDGENITLISCDEIEFTVSRKLVEKFETLKDPICGTDTKETIPVPRVSGKVFSSMLLLSNNEPLENDPSVKHLVEMLLSADFLAIDAIQGRVQVALVKKMTWNPEDLEAVFGDSGLSHEDKIEIIKAFGKKKNLPSLLQLLDIGDGTFIEPLWTLDSLKAFYNIKSIDLLYKLALIKELIENNTALLLQIVPYWAIHEKNCKMRGLDPMLTEGYMPRSSNNENKKLIQEIKTILGESFDILENELKQEYPVNNNR